MPVFLVFPIILLKIYFLHSLRYIYIPICGRSFFLPYGGVYFLVLSGHLSVHILFMCPYHFNRSSILSIILHSFMVSMFWSILTLSNVLNNSFLSPSNCFFISDGYFPSFWCVHAYYPLLLSLHSFLFLYECFVIAILVF